MKKQILIAGIFTIAFAGAAIFVGCQKEKVEQLTSSGSSAQRGGPVTIQTQNNLADNKAYLGMLNTSGSCTNPPIPSYNGLINYFTATSGAGETTVQSSICYVTGLSYNGYDCSLYGAQGTTATGTSNLFKVESNGSITTMGDLVYNGNPFYVEEMEFDVTNGDLYLINGGASFYKVAQANLNNATVTVTKVGDMFTTIGRNTYQSLCRNSSQFKLVYETGNGTTKVYDISKTTGALSNMVSYTSPNTTAADYATYYYGGTLYYAKGGSLYNLSSGSNLGSITMLTKNDGTYFPVCNN